MDEGVEQSPPAATKHVARLPPVRLYEVYADLLHMQKYMAAPGRPGVGLYWAVLRATLGAYRHPPRIPRSESRRLLVHCRGNELAALRAIFGEPMAGADIVDIFERENRLLLQAFYVGLALVLLPITLIFARRYSHQFNITASPICLCRALPMYVYYRLVIPRFWPNAETVVFFNDDNVISRPLAAICHRAGVRCVIVQHACVNSNFPPLSWYALACLDGRQAVDSYTLEKPPTRCTTSAVGALRLYPIHKRRLRTTWVERPLEVVGLAWVDIRQNDAALKIAQALIDVGYRVAVRRHPDIRRAQLTHGLGDRLELSEGPIDEFFDGIDLLISSESSLVFDAAIRGRRVVMARELATFVDYYDHAAKGICELLDFRDILGRLGNLGAFSPRLESVAYFDSFFPLDDGQLDRAMCDARARILGEPRLGAGLPKPSSTRRHGPRLPR